VARTLPVNELVTVIVHVSAEAPGTADRPVATATASTAEKRRGRVRLRITALELPRNNILYAALPGVVQASRRAEGMTLQVAPELCNLGPAANAS
jgi:hypothetical protein